MGPALTNTEPQRGGVDPIAALKQHSVIQPIASIVDDFTLFRFLEEYGGQRCFIPKTADGIAASSLTTLLGQRAVSALSASLGGNHVKIPVGRAFRVVFLTTQGLSIQEIAQRLCVDLTTIQRLLARCGAVSGWKRTGNGRRRTADDPNYSGILSEERPFND